jgi:hypothetical protein
VLHSDEEGKLLHCIVQEEIRKGKGRKRKKREKEEER